MSYTSDMKQEHVDKTAKQRHEWVGLTYEQIHSQAKKGNHEIYFALGALWAETKLKELNT